MEQHQALEIMKLGYNVYLTGEAGTGKTYVLSRYIQHLKKKHVPLAITASTGIAATHLDGVTIDSWSGLGIRDEISAKEIQALMAKPRFKNRINQAKVLVIDEISMIPGRRFDAYDQILRYIRRNPAPFGGLQVILSGDLFQLPPVSRGNHIDYIFKSRAWKELALQTCYLTTPKRQKDPVLLRLLRDIRHGTLTEETYALLRRAIEQQVPGTLTKLYTHNIDVDAINYEELDKINGEEKSFRMTYEGNDTLTGVMRKTCLAPEVLRLKKGAFVMFVRNNFREGFFNGTLGKVVGWARDGYPRVKTSTHTLDVLPIDWTIEENGRVLARLTQLPLRLAWAITVHKSQGMTLDAAEIDLSRSFVEGMGYVALSRVRTLNKLRLLGINDMALRVNQEVVALDEKLRKHSSGVVQGLQKMGWWNRWTGKRKFMYFLTS